MPHSYDIKHSIAALASQGKKPSSNMAQLVLCHDYFAFLFYKLLLFNVIILENKIRHSRQLHISVFLVQQDMSNCFLALYGACRPLVLNLSLIVFWSQATSGPSQRLVNKPLNCLNCHCLHGPRTVVFSLTRCMRSEEDSRPQRSVCLSVFNISLSLIVYSLSFFIHLVILCYVVSDLIQLNVTQVEWN